MPLSEKTSGDDHAIEVRTKFKGRSPKSGKRPFNKLYTMIDGEASHIEPVSAAVAETNINKRKLKAAGTADIIEFTNDSYNDSNKASRTFGSKSNQKPPLQKGNMNLKNRNTDIHTI